MNEGIILSLCPANDNAESSGPDAISLLMMREGIGFVEAVERLYCEGYRVDPS